MAYPETRPGQPRMDVTHTSAFGKHAPLPIQPATARRPAVTCASSRLGRAACQTPLRKSANVCSPVVVACAAHSRRHPHVARASGPHHACNPHPPTTACPPRGWPLQAHERAHHSAWEACDTLAERLRRRPAKPMGSPRVGSNPTGVALQRSPLLTIVSTARTMVTGRRRALPSAELTQWLMTASCSLILCMRLALRGNNIIPISCCHRHFGRVAKASAR